MSMSDVAVFAGSVSTTIFVASYLPMLVKAVRTKDLASYSALNLVLANVGNLVHSVYVFSLPPGPLWALHSFYLGGSALMLLWWAQFRRRARAGSNTASEAEVPDGAVTESAPSGLSPVGARSDDGIALVRTFRATGPVAVARPFVVATESGATRLPTQTRPARVRVARTEHEPLLSLSPQAERSLALTGS